MTDSVGFTVRDLAASDRSALLEWRNQERVRRFTVSQSEIESHVHAAWFERALDERAGQILVAEVRGASVGVVQLEHLDPDQRRSSWGCHLGIAAVPPGVGAALAVIGLGLGFGRWNLRRMSAEVLGINSNMLGIHRRLRIPAEGIRREDVVLDDGQVCDVHEFGVLGPEWGDIRSRALTLLPRGVRADLDALLDELDRSSGDCPDRR